MSTQPPKKSQCSNRSVRFSIMAIEDLVWEVLVRLPSKLLMRFKRVSKLWNSIIRSPKFAIAYSNGGSCFRGLLIPDNSGNNETLNGRFFYLNLNDRPTLKQHHLYQPKFTRATAVAKGLIGLLNFYSNNFTLCNIATNQLLELPPSPIPLTNYNVVFNYFIGFDVVKEVFKVFNVCFWLGMNGTLGGLVGHVLTLGVNDSDMNWRKIALAKSGLWFHCYQQCLCINGSLYWLPYRRIRKETLMAFHLNSETFETITIPEGMNNNADLVEICMRPALIVSSVEILDVWTMNNNEWSRKRVELPTSLYPYGSLKYGGTLPTGEMILVHCTSDNFHFNSIMIYDHLKNEFNTITAEGYESQESGFILENTRVYYYEENIMSLDHLMSNHEHDQTITGD